uniref:G-protein coupled receptors family 1 profile domain-containing protein n=1 Tax=Amphiprion ocellaris TaxID=80972 RepID=A0AAQ5X2X7_AMPOC
PQSASASGPLHGNVTPAVSEAGTVLPGYLVVILSVLMGTLVVVVVAGNALVIMAFIVDKTLRNQSNYFFLNLAISDFLVGAFCIPVYIPYNLTGRWMLGKGLCKVWLVMDYLLCTASVFNIVLISYDRFLSVTRAVSIRLHCGGAHYHTHRNTSVLHVLYHSHPQNVSLPGAVCAALRSHLHSQLFSLMRNSTVKFKSWLICFLF